MSETSCAAYDNQVRGYRRKRCLQQENVTVLLEVRQSKNVCRGGTGRQFPILKNTLKLSAALQCPVEILFFYHVNQIRQDVHSRRDPQVEDCLCFNHMAHYSQTPKDLAQTIAAAFGKEEQIKLYQHIRRLHDPTIVKRAFDKVQDMPTARFMESRSSLFLYLLGNYVHDENQTPKCELGAKHEGCAFSEDVEIADVGNMTIRQAL